MPKSVIMIVGVPGTGKSTLVKEFMKTTDDWEWVVIKHSPYHFSKKLNLAILGKYEEGEVFPGTDRYGLNVQPHAKELISNNSFNVLFEGDRIGNQSMAEFIADLPDTEFNILRLEAEERTLDIRYKQRGSNQDEQFLRGRQTKVDGITKNFILMEYVTKETHETKEDTARLVEWISEQLA